MPDLGSLLEREMQEIRPADFTIGNVAHRRDRRRRNQRLGTAIVALVIAVAAIGSLLDAFGDVDRDVGGPRRNGRIAFVSPGGAGPDDRLYTVAPDGSDLRQVADVYVEYPDWSPDGSMIAFDDGTVIDHIDWSLDSGHIYTMKADGKGLSQVTTGDGAEFAPDWSPDGRHIAVTAVGQNGSTSGISILDPATGAMQPVTANPYRISGQGARLRSRRGPDRVRSGSRARRSRRLQWKPVGPVRRERRWERSSPADPVADGLDRHAVVVTGWHDDRVPRRLRVRCERRARTALPDPTGRQQPSAAHVRDEREFLLAVVVAGREADRVHAVRV